MKANICSPRLVHLPHQFVPRPNLVHHRIELGSGHDHLQLHFHRGYEETLPSALHGTAVVENTVVLMFALVRHILCQHGPALRITTTTTVCDEDGRQTGVYVL
jgi:hypothetical protein